VGRLVEANPDASFTLLHRDWPASALDTVPESVAIDALGGDAGDEGSS
jgi:7-cyano-7-deazaguanine tRNA-ribosyltransferase